MFYRRFAAFEPSSPEMPGVPWERALERKLRNSPGVAHTIADMSKVKFSGDNNLRGFINAWRKVCNRSKSTVLESLREEMFLEEIQRYVHGRQTA